MPEINEVRRYADFLIQKLKNKNILEINILNGRYKKHKPFDKYKELINKLPIKLIDVKTKGKFLYMILENNYYIFSTLGLSGGWTYQSKQTGDQFEHPLASSYIDQKETEGYLKTALAHLNVEFKTDTGSVYFYDTLSFGTMKVITDNAELEKKLKELGPDIMESTTTFDLFVERITKKTNLGKEIGNVLMNQKVISGIGNYLRADILWISKISPFRKVADLEKSELKEIFHSAKLLTWGEYDRQKAIEQGIIKKSDKMPIDYGRNFFVYCQEEDIHHHKVQKDELFEGSQKRFIYWVPEIQK
jgi:formamidopyrimidine-DNA glycosylase